MRFGIPAQLKGKTSFEIVHQERQKFETEKEWLHHLELQRVMQVTQDLCVLDVVDPEFEALRGANQAEVAIQYALARLVMIVIDLDKVMPVQGLKPEGEQV